MKKHYLALALASVMLMSCGGGAKSEPTSGPSSAPSHLHVHDFGVTGKCECGRDIGRELNEQEAYEGDITFTPVNKKVYLNFYSICKAYLYIDEAKYGVPLATPDEQFTSKISSIEIYKEGSNVDLASAMGLKSHLDDDGDEKYYVHETEYVSEKMTTPETRYYCILNLANQMEELKLYCGLTNKHSYDSSSLVWEDNEDHSKRHTSYNCSECGTKADIEETYVYEVILPEIFLNPGVSLSENFVRIAKLPFVKGDCGIRIYGAQGHSNNDIVEAGQTYTIQFYVYADEDYCFSKTSTIVKDHDLNVITPASTADYALRMEMQVEAVIE
ncbi:MAG: hypothetical protein MJ239_05955 [Bacilli bacterium]|nr:hypothetical protein [Bacilli bacterium]